MVNRFVICLTFITLTHFGLSQQKPDSSTVVQRMFMPALQLGYVGHFTPQLSGGVMFQTSLEYRSKSNLIFRINYDDFEANLKIKHPLNKQVNFTGQLSFFEILGGVGYRTNTKKNYFYGLIQGGIRNYGYPQFEQRENSVDFYFTKKNIPVFRYTLGYEYEFIPQMFITCEGFIGHSLISKDYWEKSPFSWGITMGISMTLF